MAVANAFIGILKICDPGEVVDKLFLRWRSRLSILVKTAKLFLVKSMAVLCFLAIWDTESLLYISSIVQCTLNLIFVRGIVVVCTHFCRTVITNKYVYYWMHGNQSLKNLCTDYNGWKQRLSKQQSNCMN